MFSIQKLLKYICLICIIIGFLSSIIQTSTYIRFVIEAPYSINSDSPAKPGEIFFTTMDANSFSEGSSRYDESNWAELSTGTPDDSTVSDRSYNTMEELEEGYDAWNFKSDAWESDDDSGWGELKRNIETWSNSANKELMHEFAESGHLKWPITPTTGNTTIDFYLGFMGNPEHNTVEQNAKKAYSKFRSAGYTADVVGPGMFMLIVPYPGFYVASVNLTSHSDEDTTIYEWTYDVGSERYCTGSSCKLDYNDNLYTSYEHEFYCAPWHTRPSSSCKLYVGLDTAAWDYDSVDGDGDPPIGSKASVQELPHFETSLSNIPSNFRLSPEITDGSYDGPWVFMPAMMVVSRSIWLSQECFPQSSLCATEPDRQFDKSEIFLWEEVMSVFDDTFGIATSLNTTTSSDDINSQSTSTERISCIDDCADEYDDWTPQYSINESAWSRSELPIILSFWSQYSTGVSSYTLINASSQIIPSTSESNEFGVYVRFNQIGYSISAEISNTDSAVSSVVSADHLNEGASYGYLEEDITSITTSAGNCIFYAYEFKTPVVFGGVTSNGAETSTNLLTEPLYIGDSVDRTNTMNDDYTYYIKAYDPSFEIAGYTGSGAGSMSIGGRISTLDTQTTFGTTDVDEQTISAVNALRVDQDAYNDTYCAYQNHYHYVSVTASDGNYITGVTANYSTLYTQYTTENVTYYRENVQNDVKYTSNAYVLVYLDDSTSNATIQAGFEPYPVLTIDSTNDSDVSGRFTVNVWENYLDDNTEFLYTIRPNSDYDEGDSITVVSVNIDLDISKILYKEKISMSNSNTGVTLAVFTSAPLENKSTTTSNADSDSGITINYTLLNVSGNYLSLTIPDMTDDSHLYIDFEPLALYIDTTPNFGESLTMSVTEYGYTTELLKTSKYIEYGETLTIDSSMGADMRKEYYFSDVYLFDQTESSCVWDTPSSESSASSSLFSGHYYEIDEWETNSIYNDSCLFLGLTTLKDINVVFTSTQNRGEVIANLTGLEATETLPSTLVSYYASENLSHIISGNVIYMSELTTGNIGFREYDELDLYLVPELGYYVKNVTININSEETNITSLLETYSSAPSAKTLSIDSVSNNIILNVEFEEKPSYKGFWQIGPF